MFAPSALAIPAYEIAREAARSSSPHVMALACVAVGRLIPGAPQVAVNVLDAVEAWARGTASEWEIEKEMEPLRVAFRRGPAPALSVAEYTAALATVCSCGGALVGLSGDAVQYAVDAGVSERAAALAVLGVVGGEGQVAA